MHQIYLSGCTPPPKLNPPQHIPQKQPNVRLRNELRQKYPALYQLRLETVAKENEVCAYRLNVYI